MSDPTGDTWRLIVLANLAFTAGILGVLALRKPVRLRFGARLAYTLWLLPLLAALATLLPARVVNIPVRTAGEFAISGLAHSHAAIPADMSAHSPLVSGPLVSGFAFDPALLLILLWIAGVAVMVGWLGRRQASFLADLRKGIAGPAVIGIFRPRIVTPSDFEARFDDRERLVIIAHESIHLARNDARINALAALLRCLCWYNPLVHIAAYLLRIDQELSCDAAVIQRHPRARKLYADALVKAQLVARPLPFGCYWPAGGEHPLMERIAMLKRAAPGRARSLTGVSLIAALTCASGFAAWAAKPAHETYGFEEPAPQPSRTTAPQLADSTPQPDLGALDAAPTAKPRPEQRVRFEPQQTPAAATTGNAVTLKGKIMRFDIRNPNSYVWVQGETLNSNKPGRRAEATSNLYRVTVGSKDMAPEWALEPDAIGATVSVLAYETANTACSQECELSGLSVRLAAFPTAGGFCDPVAWAAPGMWDTCIPRKGMPSPALTGPNQFQIVGGNAPKSLVMSPPDPGPDFDARYNTEEMQTLRGTIASAERVDGNMVLLVNARTLSMKRLDPDKAETRTWRVTVGPIPGFQNILNTLAPQLLGQDVSIRGYSAKNDACAPMCLMIARNVTVIDKSGTSPAAPPPPLPPRPAPQPILLDQQAAPSATVLPDPGVPFAARFNAERPILLKGKITRIAPVDGDVSIWITSTSVASGPGAADTAPASWQVLIGRVSRTPADFFTRTAPKLVGQNVTVRGYGAKDEACKPDCLMNGRDLTLQSGAPLPDGLVLPPALPPARTAAPPPAAPPVAHQPIRYEPQHAVGGGGQSAQLIPAQYSSPDNRPVHDLSRPHVFGVLSKLVATFAPPDVADFATRYDNSREIAVQGMVTGVETEGDNLVLVITGRRLGADASPTPQTWRASVGRIGPSRSALAGVKKASLNQEVTARGYRLRDDACVTSCTMVSWATNVLTQPAGAKPVVAL